jgi:hypothetical protein
MWNDVDARYIRTCYPYYTLRGGKSLLHLLSFEALLFDDIAVVPCLSAASRLSEDIMPSPLPGHDKKSLRPSVFASSLGKVDMFGHPVAPGLWP